MARLFISHASADTETAVRVKEWLASDGHCVFVDRDCLLVGDLWRERLHDEIRRADAVVCLVTAAFNASSWCAAEIGIAQSLGKRIFPIRGERDASHELISGDVQYADLTGDPDRARTELVRALRLLAAQRRAGVHRLLGKRAKPADDGQLSAG